MRGGGAAVVLNALGMDASVGCSWLSLLRPGLAPWGRWIRMCDHTYTAPGEGTEVRIASAILRTLSHWGLRPHTFRPQESSSRPNAAASNSTANPLTSGRAVIRDALVGSGPANPWIFQRFNDLQIESLIKKPGSPPSARADVTT